MIKPCLLISITLLFAHFTWGQPVTIRGTVTSGQQVKLPYATVRIFKDTVETTIAVCDSTGYFEGTLTLTGQEKLYVKAYFLKLSSSLQQVNPDNSTIHLVIDDQKNELSAVLVQADKTVIQRRSDRYIFIPNRALTQGNNVLDVLRHAPLLTYRESTETLSIINKPGTIVYINNKKSAVPKEMLIQMLRSLPASDIKSIEIITNPGSEYNASITGGIININVKRLAYEGWLGNLALQTIQSVYNTTMLNGSVSYRKGKLALQLIPFVNSSYNYYTIYNELDYTNGVQAQLNKRHYRRYTVLGGGINADYDINARSFVSIKSFNSHVNGKSATDVATNYATQPVTDSMLKALTTGKDVYSYNFGNVNYHYLFDSAGKSWFDANLDYNYFYQRRKYDGQFQKLDRATGAYETTGQYQNILPQQFYNLSERVEWGKNLTPKTKLTSGLQYSHTKVENNLEYYNLKGATPEPDASLSNKYNYREKYWAAFVNFNSELSAKWSANLGVRAEGTNYATEVKNLGIRKDSVYTNVFPSFGLGYAPAAKHQFGYSLSRRIARPNIELLFPGRTYNSPTYFIENNPFLQPSLIYNNELSYIYNNKYTLTASWMAAKNKYASFVIPVEESNSSKLKETFLNYGTVKSLSLVLNANKSLFKGFWEVYITASYIYGKYSGKVADQPFDVRNNNFNLFFDNYIYLSRKSKWTGFVTFKYNGSSKDINGSTMNATTALDLELKKVYRKFSFYVIASDVYNGSSILKTNQYATYLLTGNYAESNTYNRSVLFKVRYGFGNNKLKTNKNRNTANQDIKNRAG
jgi:iron complex outermembrane recepter protein